MRRWPLAVGVMLASCSQSEGLVSIGLEWRDAAPTDIAGLWVHATVEEREYLDVSGRVLAGDVAPLGRDTSLTLRGIPNGIHRVLVVEIRDGSDRIQSRVHYRGISRSFAISPNQRTEVLVALELERVPVVSEVEVESETPGFVRAARTWVSLRATRAETIIAAKDPGFTVGRQQYDAFESEVFEEPPTAGGMRHRVEVDLNDGLCEGTECLDGIRMVFVKVVDGAGYESLSGQAQVTLDRRGPKVLPLSTDAELVPGADNLLLRPTALTYGSVLRVAFRLDEPVVRTPTVTAIGTGLLALSPTSTGADAFEVRLALGTATELADGPFTILVESEDRAGNRSTETLELSNLWVDTATPARPDPDRVVHRREPWDGAAEVRGEAGAVEPLSTVIIFERLRPRVAGDPPLSGANELARGLAGPDGSFRIPLSGPDRARLHLLTVDAAGNPSDPEQTLIERGEWVATLHGKIPGRSVPNPHDFYFTAVVGPALAQDPTLVTVLDGAETAKLLAPDGETVSTPGYSGRWVERRISAAAPAPRWAHAMAFDRARGKLVMFGGNFPQTGDTWEWDGEVWEQRTPVGRPRDRYLASMAYDARRGRTVLFGGNAVSASATRLDDTWEWDGTSWTEASPSGVGPSRRLGASMAYDELNRQVVLFGGFSDRGPEADLWSWDGSAWTELAAGPAPPSGRTGAAMAFDAARDELVVFGGLRTTPLDETWTYHRQRGWRHVDTGTTSPGELGDAAMAYDPVERVVILFGGTATGRDGLSRTWTWDGLRWRLRDSSQSPPPRSGHGLQYDSVRKRVVLFGGCGLKYSFEGMCVTQPYSDVWTWSEVGWVDETPSSAAPRARSEGMMQFDASRQRTVLFGGWALGEFLGDTWEWDGLRWTNQTLTSTGPSARIGAHGSFDSYRERLVLFGGEDADGQFLRDTWERVGTAWVSRTSATEAPEARAYAGQAYDSALRQTILFGGAGDPGPFGDTWTWDGQRWLRWRDSPLAPDPRRRPGMARLQTGEILLFGGESDPRSFDDTWSWRGQWSEVQVQRPRPAYRSAHSLAECGSDRALLFGGIVGIGQSVYRFDDTWEWTGQRWVERPSPVHPSIRAGSMMAYDSRRDRVVLFGGETNSDTWEWHRDPAERPAGILRVDLSDSGLTATELTRVQLSSYAGATGFSALGTLEVGVSGLAWVPGSSTWSSSGGMNTAAPDRPDLLRAEWRGHDAAALITGDQTVVLQIAPRGGVGVDEQTVLSVDSVVVNVEYRLLP